MSESGDTFRGPTRDEVEAKLLDLITGRCDRRHAADWAAYFVVNDAEVADSGVWEALVALAGADLASSDRKFLHGEADFCVWLETLKGSAD
jgi:hypothetical protein